MPLCQQARQHILRVVHILILIHEDVAELVLVAFAGMRLGFQQSDDLVDEVVEVERVGGAQVGLVPFVDAGDDALEIVAGGLAVLVRANQSLFRAADGVADGARADLLLVDIEVNQNAAHHLQLVAVVVDDEVGGNIDGASALA
jgi:hypothetical protein